MLRLLSYRSALQALAMLAAVPTLVAAQSPTPEEAAAREFAATRPGELTLEPRYARGLGPDSEFGAMRTAEATERLAGVLGANVRRYEEAIACKPPREGEFPFARCQVQGAKALIGLSPAEIDGDVATVYVTIRDNLGHGMSAGQFKVTVRRTSAGWVFEKMVLIAAT